MSVFDDWGDALAGPFETFGRDWGNLFTDPSKLKAKNLATFLLPVPGVGSAITYDIDHPEAAGYQAATIAAIAGGAHALEIFGPSSFASASDQAAAQAAHAELAASMNLFSAPAATPSAASLIASDFGAPSAAQLIAADFPAKAVAASNAATATSATATAAKAAAGASTIKTLTKGFLQNVKDAGPIAATLALLQGGKAKAGAGVNGGANPPVSAAGVPIPVPVASGGGGQPAVQAKATNFLMVGAVLGVGYWLWKKYK